MKSEITTEAPEASHAATLPLDHLRQISASWRMACLSPLLAAAGYVLCRRTVAGWLAFGSIPGLMFLDELTREGVVAVSASKSQPLYQLRRDARTEILSWEAVS